VWPFAKSPWQVTLECCLFPKQGVKVADRTAGKAEPYTCTVTVFVHKSLLQVGAFCSTGLLDGLGMFLLLGDLERCLLFLFNGVEACFWILGSSGPLQLLVVIGLLCKLWVGADRNPEQPPEALRRKAPTFVQIVGRGRQKPRAAAGGSKHMHSARD
jgi:hypothetical protein